jgi:hypothetical protein
MVDKVKRMVKLVKGQPAVKVQIISAMREGWIARALVEENFSGGTTIHA